MEAHRSSGFGVYEHPTQKTKQLFPNRETRTGFGPNTSGSEFGT
jgi:hypothetical protein